MLCPRPWRRLLAPLRIALPEPRPGLRVEGRQALACIANRQGAADRLARATWLRLRPAAPQPRRGGLDGRPDRRVRPGNLPRYAGWSPRARLRAPVRMPAARRRTRLARAVRSRGYAAHVPEFDGCR